jgi:hypothetical protein
MSGGWRERITRLVALPLVVYLAAALFMTWPLATQITTHFAGPGHTDSYEYARLGWWGRYALMAGLNPFYQSRFAHPDGYFDAVQAAQPLIYWPISILGALVGDVAAFNIWLLLTVILSGLTAYWLCRDVLTHADPGAERGDPTLPALIGGLVFMSFPAVQGHLSVGHVNPLSNYALPIVALYLYRLISGRGSLRGAIFGAVALLILALGNFTFPVFILLPLLLFGGGYALLARREWLRWHAVRLVAVMLGGGALLSLPFYLPLARELLAADRPAYLQEGGWVRYSTDLLAFVSPSPFTSWAGALVPDYARAAIGTNSAEGAAYLGLSTSLLALIALMRRREARLWLVIALGCMVFSLGPLLKIGDQPATYRLGTPSTEQYESNIILPYALIQHLPLISSTRTPGRFNITTGLALGVLAALGLHSVWGGTYNRSAWRFVAVALVAGLILFEYQLFAPFPTTPAALPDYFRGLAVRGDGRAVFDVPTDDVLAQKWALWQQTAHHQPLVAGYVSRRSSVDPAKLTLLSDVLTAKSVPFPTTADAFRGWLHEAGIGVVVYHRAQLASRWADVQMLTETVFGVPVFEDERIAVYEVVPSAERPTSLWFSFGSGFYTERPNDRLMITTQWLGKSGTLYLYAPDDRVRDMLVVASPLLESRRLQLHIDGQAVRAWQIDAPSEQLFFPLRLDKGFHTLQFVTPSGCVTTLIAPHCLVNGATVTAACMSPTLPSCVSIGLTGLQVMNDSGLPYQAVEGEFLYGLTLKAIRQPSYARAKEMLRIEMDWLARERLPGDYHLFVHVLDAAGKQVAGYDGVPGENTFPTTQWAVPQRWLETVQIPLPAGLPPGQYEVYVGWYHYPDLTRLAVLGTGNGAQSQLFFTGFLEIP